MNWRDYRVLAADVQRLRPLATIVLAILLLLPSLSETVTGDLPVVTLLARLALALLVSGVLVWIVTGVVLHYARVQAQSGSEGRRKRDIER
ncbi:MAG: hypothetical protein ABSF84_03815 [Acidimicrobiales bacterium]|jgi:hypothetical protein